MEAEARYTYVGIGVLVLIASLLTGVLWLKNVGGKGDFNRFAIHFEKQALDGLEVGADVTLRGIKVGRVEDYALAGDKLNRVRVAVRVDRRAPVRTNTVAVVTRNFVTGIAAIMLVNGEPPGAPLVDIPEGETYPIIGEGRSGLDEIAGRVSQVGELASVTLNSLNQLFDAKNREAMIATVRSLRDLSAGLNKRLGALDKTLASADEAASRFASASAQLGDAGQRIATVAESSGTRLERTLTETDRTLVETQAAVRQLTQAASAVQQQAVATAKRLEDSAGRVDDQLGAALLELQMTVETATRVLDGLREPRAALLGPGKAQLGPGERLP